jgi:hypothetical protein
MTGDSWRCVTGIWPKQPDVGRVRRSSPSDFIISNSTGCGDPALQISGVFPHARSASRKGEGCRYQQPGELGRSLLKERYLYEDARFNSLPRRRGQVSARLCLSAGAGVGIGGDSPGRSANVADGFGAAASNPAALGARGIFALPPGDRTAAVAVCPGSSPSGFVDAPGTDCAAPACGDGGSGCLQRSLRPEYGTISRRRWDGAGAKPDSGDRGQPNGSVAGKGAREEGSPTSFS